MSKKFIKNIYRVVAPFTFFALCLFFLPYLNSCARIPEKENERQLLLDIEFIKSLKTIKIEGCEYFFHNYVTITPLLVHKGNCTNPIHQQ